MIVRKVFLVAMLAVLAVAAAPSRASADWYITPFIGGNFGGSADFNGVGTDFEDQVERRVDMGASLGWMGAGIAGFELDWGWSPNFFQNTTGSGNFVTGDSNVTTLMANIVLGVPVGGQTGGGVRPYVVGGVGLLRSNISADDVSHRESHVERFRLRSGRRRSRLLQRSRWLARRHPILPFAAGQRTLP